MCKLFFWETFMQFLFWKMRFKVWIIYRADYLLLLQLLLNLRAEKKIILRRISKSVRWLILLAIKVKCTESYVIIAYEIEFHCHFKSKWREKKTQTKTIMWNTKKFRSKRCVKHLWIWIWLCLQTKCKYLNDTINSNRK